MEERLIIRTHEFGSNNSLTAHGTAWILKAKSRTSKEPDLVLFCLLKKCIGLSSRCFQQSSDCQIKLVWLLQMSPDGRHLANRPLTKNGRLALFMATFLSQFLYLFVSERTGPIIYDFLSQIRAIFTEWKQHEFRNNLL